MQHKIEEKEFLEICYLFYHTLYINLHGNDQYNAKDLIYHNFY